LLLLHVEKAHDPHHENQDEENEAVVHF
jgi:hypothetical protein